MPKEMLKPVIGQRYLYLRSYLFFSQLAYCAAFPVERTCVSLPLPVPPLAATSKGKIACILEMQFHWMHTELKGLLCILLITFLDTDGTLAWDIPAFAPNSAPTHCGLEQVISVPWLPVFSWVH